MDLNRLDGAGRLEFDEERGRVGIFFRCLFSLINMMLQLLPNRCFSRVHLGNNRIITHLYF